MMHEGLNGDTAERRERGRGEEEESITQKGKRIKVSTSNNLEYHLSLSLSLSLIFSVSFQNHFRYTLLWQHKVKRLHNAHTHTSVQHTPTQMKVK